MATPSLLPHITVSTYCNHLPLYRQAGIPARAGIHITQPILATTMIKIAERLVALVNLLHEEIIEYDRPRVLLWSRQPSLTGREPKRYLEYAFERIDRAETLADIEALFPWHIPLLTA